MEKIKLQKYIANTGYCSRRKADELISLGKSVRVNGKVAVVGMKVSDADKITIEGKDVNSRQKKIYIKFNKPSGYTCTSAKFKSEKNVYELLPQKLQSDKSLHIVGRLDKESCGLLLFTNDGSITQKLTHPSFEHEKKYVVTLRDKRARDAKDIIRKFTTGMHLKDIGDVRAKKVEYVGDNIFKITLTEGKKRQIRRMFAEMHEWIVSLKRVSIGGLELGGLEEKNWEYLTAREVKGLRK